MNTFTHAPDALGHPMLNVGEIIHMHGRTIAGVARSAPKVVWVLADRLRSPANMYYMVRKKTVTT